MLAVLVIGSNTGMGWLDSLAVAVLLVLSSIPGASDAADTPDRAPASRLDAEESRDEGGYVGSDACRGCHTFLHERWRGTRHGRTIRSPESARRDGFPLPGQRPGGSPSSIKRWSDVLYVFGAKQRVAYVGRDGMVDGTAFHQRLDDWRSFPSGHVVRCAACHTTGHDPTAAAAAFDPASPPWQEADIGCEACHGPGARHAASLERADIRLDPSSRVCGQCHTRVGAVLPRDDRHDTHDLVQSWHRDPHVLGTRWQSHDGFCARCHSPFEARRGDAGAAARRAVHAERKHDVSCIACHDPHDSTDDAHRRDAFERQPPRPSTAQVLRGYDGDFTTPDYDRLADTERSCLACHRGADRIELDHAGATCNDCHVGYWRNRGRDSRVFHDANHPELSCRGCHADADHLMSVLFLDEAFLDPRHVHDLGSLPAAAVERHGLHHAALRAKNAPPPAGPTRTLVAASPPGENAPTTLAPSVGSLTSGEAPAPAHRPASSAPPRLPAVTGVPATSGMAPDPGPRSVAHALSLAHGYLSADRPDTAREVLRRSLREDTTWSALELPIDPGDAPSEAREGDTEDIARELVALLDGDDRVHLEAWLAMWSGDAGRSLERLDDIAAPDATTGFHRGLVLLALGRTARANDAFRAAAERAPDRAAPLVGLGLAALRAGAPAEGRHRLESAAERAPADAVARYLLGRAWLGAGRPERAMVSLSRALALAPDFPDAALALARAARATGDDDRALALYRGVAAAYPDDPEPPFRSAQLLKSHADRLRFRLLHEVEARPPPGRDGAHRLARLGAWRERVRTLENEALAHYRNALALDPGRHPAIRQVAEIFRHQGRLEEASDMLRWLEPRHPNAWLIPYRLGAIAFERGDLGAARDAFGRAAAIAPVQADVHAGIGALHLAAGEPARAATALRRAIALEPFNPGVYTNLGVAEARLGRLDQAARALERALELATFPLPRRHIVHANLAIIAARRGDREASTLALERALHAYPGFEAARSMLESLDRPRAVSALARESLLTNDWLEIFGEVTTVSFNDR